MSADTSSRKSLFLQSILADTDGLSLNEHQVAALNRMYWLRNEQEGDAVSAVAGLLSTEQFRAAVGRFVASAAPGGAESGAANPEAIDAMVAASFEKRTKDKSVVEIELATKVADRLIAWSKTFGIFIAAPLAILLIILSLFGLSKFEDVRQAANRADELLKQAQSQISDGNTKLGLAERQLAEAADRANQRAQEVDRQIAALRDNSAQIASQVSSLGHTVQQIESQLGGLSAQFETGNMAPGKVSGAGPTGKSYGTWGMGQQIVGTFVAQQDFPWRQEFQGLAPGSPEFDSAWQALGNREGERFKDAQRVFIEAHYFQPAAKLLKEHCDLDVANHSHALQEVVWAMAVYQGPRVASIDHACQSLRQQGKPAPADPEFDEALIRDSYAPLIERFPAMRREMQMALEQLASEKSKKP